MIKEQHPYCECLLFSASALSRVLNQIAEQEFASTNLSPSHAFILFQVLDAQEEGICVGQLAKSLFLQPSTITRLIDKMESMQLVNRKAKGRKSIVHATSKAKEMEAALRQAWKNVYKSYVSALGEFSSNQLTQLIAQATSNLESANANKNKIEVVPLS